MCNDPARRGARGMNNDLANLILSREIMAAAADCLQSGNCVRLIRPPNVVSRPSHNSHRRFSTDDANCYSAMRFQFPINRGYIIGCYSFVRSFLPSLFPLRQR